MLERVVAAAIKEAPAAGRLSEEAFWGMRVALQNGLATIGKPIEGSMLAGRTASSPTGAIAHFPGHSTIQEGRNSLRVIGDDGSKLHITPDKVELELLDGTHVSKLGNEVTTRLPGGDLIHQRRIAPDRMFTTVNGKELKTGEVGKEIGDGASFYNFEKHESYLFLRDQTHINYGNAGFDLSRMTSQVKPMWTNRVDLSVEQSLSTLGKPSLKLLTPDGPNNYSSAFLTGSAEQGIALKTREIWTRLSDIVK